MKAQARAILEKLIYSFATYGMPGKHFKGSHQAQKGAEWREIMRQMAEKEARGEATLVNALAGTPPGKKAVGTHYVEMVSVVDAAYHIMERIAHRKPVGEVDLNCLTQALNEWTDPIRLQDDGTYRRGASTKGQFVEDFLGYMNLASRYEPQHDICEVCGSLMLAGRGGKKYCSAECRNKYWNYERQKEHYVDKPKRKGGK
jgi:hypothetical protein